jgi:hypothetical protein
MIALLVLSCWYRNGNGRSVEEFEADVDQGSNYFPPRQIRAHEKVHWPYHSNYEIKALHVPAISNQSEGSSMSHLSFHSPFQPNTMSRASIDPAAIERS